MTTNFDLGKMCTIFVTMENHSSALVAQDHALKIGAKSVGLIHARYHQAEISLASAPKHEATKNSSNVSSKVRYHSTSPARATLNPPKTPSRIAATSAKRLFTTGINDANKPLKLKTKGPRNESVAAKTSY